MVFVAEIIAGSDEAVGVPMTYKYYVEELGGPLPKIPPTYLPPARTFDKSSGESFVCSVCGYVYRDPNFGFEELPADWDLPRVQDAQEKPLCEKNNRCSVQPVEKKPLARVLGAGGFLCLFPKSAGNYEN